MAPLLRPSLLARRGAAFLSSTVLLLGCEPLPENVGNGLTTSGDAGSSAGEGTLDDGDSSGGAPLDPEPKWELLLAPARNCTNMALMPDGGVVVLLADTLADDWDTHNELHRYAPDGTFLWERPAGTEMVELATLPDGRIVIGGSVSQAPRQAAVWVLSPDGAVQATYMHPRGDVDGDAVVTQLASDGGSRVAFVVTHYEGGGAYAGFDVVLAGIDLVPQWSWKLDDPLDSIYDVQISAAGSVRTLELDYQQEQTRLRTFAATGSPEHEQFFDGWMTFALGAPGAMVTYDEAGLRLHGLDELPELGDDVVLGPELAGVPEGHHGDGLLVGGSTAGGSSLTIKHVDVDGTLIWDRTLPPTVATHVSIDAIAPGPDGSVYLCGSEFETPDDAQAFLSRRYPLW